MSILNGAEKTEKLSIGGRKNLNLYLYLLVGGKIRLFERTFSHFGGYNGKVGGDNHFFLDVCVVDMMVDGDHHFDLDIIVCVYDIICHSPLQSKVNGKL